MFDILSATVVAKPMHSRAAALRTSRFLSGGTIHTFGRLLSDERQGATVLLDPETGGELARERMPAFQLSTEGEASDGHIVRQLWDLSRADTVGIPILWGHQRRGDVLGQWRDLAVRDTGNGPQLVARADFDMEHPLAAEKAGQVRRGYVRAVSIGWQAGEVVRRGELPEDDPRYRAPTDDECGQPSEGLVMGTEASPNVLMEASLVPVPADSGAYAIDRALARGSEFLERSRPLGVADLDSFLSAIATHPAARAWIDRQIRTAVDREVRAVLEAERARVAPAEVPSLPRAGVARFRK